MVFIQWAKNVFRLLFAYVRLYHFGVFYHTREIHKAILLYCDACFKNICIIIPYLSSIPFLLLFRADHIEFVTNTHDTFTFVFIIANYSHDIYFNYDCHMNIYHFFFRSTTVLIIDRFNYTVSFLNYCIDT